MFECKKTEVNPLFAATFSPFSIVSVVSKPGSPKTTEVSNQPCETCKLSFSMTSKPAFTVRFFPILEIIPFVISISTCCL